MGKLIPYNKNAIARVPARKVDLLYNEMDFKVCIMANLGMSTMAICERTGLSHCQVTYRIARANIKRSEYRNGQSPMAQAIMRQAQTIAAPITKKQIQDRLREIGG